MHDPNGFPFPSLIKLEFYETKRRKCPKLEQSTRERRGEQAAQLMALHKASIFANAIRREEMGTEPILERGGHEGEREGERRGRGFQREK